MKFATTLALAGTMTIGAMATANAALIDFTDNASYDISGTSGAGTVGDLSYTLSASGGKLTNDEMVDFDVSRIAPLLGTVDGLGIRDDEVTFPGESLTVSFTKGVQISALYFLDLFGTTHADGSVSNEGVTVTNGAGEELTFLAQTQNQDGTVGFGDFQNLTLSGRSFTFTPTEPNDSLGNPDFALAGIEAAAVPLPAGILLLGGALGGLGFARRRKQKTA